MIYGPYQDWKYLLEDIKNHAFNEYHLNSMTRLNELMRTTNNPEKGREKITKSLKKIGNLDVFY